MTYNSHKIAKLNNRINDLHKRRNPNYALIDDLINEIAILEIESGEQK